MTATRKNVEFAKRIGMDRVGNDYVYGGNWDPFNLSTGTDCSGVVIDICDATQNGTAMAWTRHGMSTETWRLADPNNGPFGAKRVSHPSQFPADAAVKMAFAHYGGGANSHTWCEVDGVRFESHGSTAKYPNGACVTGAEARDVNDTSYANDWWYIPGPIIEDGTPMPEPADTLFADVSEWQVPVNDSYPYKVLTIRSNDGTYRDKDWAANYAWCKAAVDSGKLTFFIVYFVWRPNWRDAVATLKSQIGPPHPRMAIMLDVESWGGQAAGGISGDQSAGINAAFEDIAAWLGDRRRVIGYGNVGDLNALWPNKPAGVRLIVAGYGKLPTYPGMIAHQYTDGQGYGGGLPEGAPPFGNCDMNAANGLTATAFADALGIGAPVTPAPTPEPAKKFPDEWTDRELMIEILRQQRGYNLDGWPQLGQDEHGNNLTVIDALAKLLGTKK